MLVYTLLKMSVKVEPKEKCHVCNLELDKFDLFVHFEKTHSTTGSENTRPVTPDAESVVSSGMLTTIELFYLPIF